MSRLIRYLRGSVRFRLTGAAPEQCLNALAAARLEFWDIEREDALHLSLCVPAREAERLQRLALRCLCTAEVTERSGLRAQFGGLLRRPSCCWGCWRRPRQRSCCRNSSGRSRSREMTGSRPGRSCRRSRSSASRREHGARPSIRPRHATGCCCACRSWAWLGREPLRAAGAGARDGAAAAAGTRALPTPWPMWWPRGTACSRRSP